MEKSQALPEKNKKNKKIMFAATAFSDLMFYWEVLNQAYTAFHFSNPAQIPTLLACHILVLVCIRAAQVKSVGILFDLKLLIIYNVWSACNKQKEDKIIC